jgi:hypothetical protein
MLPLILLTFSVFFTLWVGDFYLTIKTAKKIGPTAELNPIIRGFLRLRGNYVWVFKIVELGIFFYLIYYLTSFTGTVPFYVLLGYIIFYGILVTNNNRVYYNVTGKQTMITNYIFIGIVIFITLFIYLNYLLYSNLTVSYNILMECHSSFSNLYWTCQKQNATGDVTLPSDLESILKSLNLTISKPW